MIKHKEPISVVEMALALREKGYDITIEELKEIIKKVFRKDIKKLEKEDD